MGKGRAPCCDKSKVKKGPWSPEEDLKLITFVHQHGHPNWRSLPSQAGLLRCGKSCRLRWINYLRPDVKRGNVTREEEEIIIKLHQVYGNKWSKIASFIPGRTDNEIKNVWNTHLKVRLGARDRKGNASKRPKPKKITSGTHGMESSSKMSTSSLSSNEHVDRDSKATTGPTNTKLGVGATAEVQEFQQNRRSDEQEESPSTPSFTSCLSNASLRDEEANTKIDGFGALHDGSFQVPSEFGEPAFWDTLEFDNICTFESIRPENRPSNAFEVSGSSVHGLGEGFDWIRYLEIELGLDDSSQGQQ